MNDPIATPDSNRPAQVSTWNRKVGPYGEVLTVVALSGAAFCFLFTEMREVRFGLGLCALLAAIPFYVAAFRHKELSKLCEDEQNKLAGNARYRVSSARLDILRTAKVPVDVLKALSTLSGRSPMSKEELLSTLIYDLDLGCARTKDFENVILKYTKFDERPQPPATIPNANAAPPTAAQSTQPPAVAVQPARDVPEPVAVH